jgi:urease accessory protein UreE
MSQVYNPETEVISEIEKLELEARDFRRKIERAHTNEDRRVMNRLLTELRDRITFLRRQLP